MSLIFKIQCQDGRPAFFVEAQDVHEAKAKAKEVALIFEAETAHGFGGELDAHKLLGADGMLPDTAPFTTTLVPGATIVDDKGVGPSLADPGTAIALMRQQAIVAARRDLGERIDGFRDTIVSSFKRLEAGIADAPIVPQNEMWEAFIAEAEAKAAVHGLTVDFQLGILGRWFRDYKSWHNKLRGNLRLVQERLSGT